MNVSYPSAIDRGLHPFSFKETHDIAVLYSQFMYIDVVMYW